jgi:hypothetical protein
MVSSDRRSDFEGKVESFAEKDTFFFMRRMNGEVEETDGGPFCGSGGGVSASVHESGPEDVEVVEFCENIESTDERMLDDIEELK